jgi:WD40 repeat protein
LPHPAYGVTMAAVSDCVLVATVIPSPDDMYTWIGRPDGQPLRPHVLHLSCLRISDWSVVSETKEELQPTSLSSYWEDSLRVRWMPDGNAWILGIGDPKQGTYRISLHDPNTLETRDQHTFPKALHNEKALLCLDDSDSSTIVLGRPDSRHYRWDLWETDSGSVRSVETSPAEMNPSDPDAFRPSEYSLATPCEASALSAGASFYAEALSGQMRAAGPVPIFSDNGYLADLEVEDLARHSVIVRGKFQGEAEAITSLRFTPDNKQLLSGHKGGIVRVWDLKPPL